MRMFGRMIFPLVVLIFAIFVWGCENGGQNPDDGARLGSTLVGGDDGGGSSGGDHQNCEGCCPDSMDHSQGDMGDMGGMNGGSGGMGGMHGGDGDSSSTHCSSDQGDPDQDPGEDEHGGHH
jgi:hypothetical protein